MIVEPDQLTFVYENRKTNRGPTVDGGGLETGESSCIVKLS